MEPTRAPKAILGSQTSALSSRAARQQGAYKRLLLVDRLHRFHVVAVDDGKPWLRSTTASKPTWRNVPTLARIMSPKL
ncbi:hypothetical protein BKA81DRAFT_347696 [Phyllosticta paracitricarpa]